MKKLLILLPIFTALLCFCACSKETQPSANFEKPVENLCESLSRKDGATYLNCFVPAEKKAYLVSDSGAGTDGIIGLVRENSKLGDDERVSCEITGKRELSEELVSNMQRAYKKKYSRNDTIEKAMLLNVNFSNDKGVDIREITVVMIDESWYIYGDIIERFKF